MTDTVTAVQLDRVSRHYHMGESSVRAVDEVSLSVSTGEFLALDPLGADNWWLRVRVPAELDPYLVYKGSIAIDGISTARILLLSPLSISPAIAATPSA